MALLDFIPCRLLQLPVEEIIPAARTATLENPANAARLMPAAPEDEEEPAPPPSPMRLALMTQKYWGAGGVKLTVSFLDNPTASLRKKILEHANAWGQWANVMFTETATSGQVRIARVRGQGYYSYLGTDILHIPRNQQTLNLDSFTDSTPDSEFYRVVRHEIGHTLGFPHEHLRREIVGRLDPQKTIAYFGRTQGWSAQEVQQQVLTPLVESELRDNAADVLSIMCYQLPAEITTDGQSIPGGSDIDDSDKQLVAQLYPGAVIVKPPPPPPPPPPVKPPVSAAGVDIDVWGMIEEGTYTLIPRTARTTRVT